MSALLSPTLNAAIYVSNSKNSKISGVEKVDTTYVSIKASCPSTCPLKESGCYAKTGYVGISVSRLDKSAVGMTALQAAQSEAKAIDSSYGGGDVPSRNLRLHVSGDTRTIRGAEVVNAAVRRWKRRGGKACFSYTHAWRTIPRAKWSEVSMLASVSSVKEAKEARTLGYAPALVVAEHVSDKTYQIKGSTTKWIPCPAQTRENVTCSSCRLCLKADWLHESNHGIAFAAHGATRNSVKRHLKMVNTSSNLG